MKVLIAASEIATLAQTGGLADVTRSLAIALQKKGVEVALVLPKYRQVEIEGDVISEIEITIEDRLVSGRIRQIALPNTDIPVFLVDQDHYFNREGIYTEKGRDYSDNLERFTFFCRAILKMIAQGHWQPDLIHSNDWQTALIPIYIKTLFKDHAVLGKIKTLFTIHNLAFQGLFPIFLYPIIGLGWEHFNLSELEFYNQINLLKGGIVFADAINTVSPNYAKEIQTTEFGSGMEGLLKEKHLKLTGILNRVDYEQWSPENDPYIVAPYTLDSVLEGKALNKKAVLNEFGLPIPDTRKPLMGVVSRLTVQKGCDLIAAILPTLAQRGVQVVAIGTGDPKIESTYRNLEKQFPESFAVKVMYDTKISHWVEAGADLFLMPSRFEPCGLNQMYSMCYGTIPIVRAIGGLADTVIDVNHSPEGNGFTFNEESPEALLEACERAISLFENEEDWVELIKRAMRIDFSWDRSAQDYFRLYQSIL